MRVFVLEAYSYDPEDVQGVFTTEHKALNWLKKHGWKPCPEPLNNKGECGCCPKGTYHDPRDWKRARIVEHKVQ